MTAVVGTLQLMSAGLAGAATMLGVLIALRLAGRMARRTTRRR